MNEIRMQTSQISNKQKWRRVDYICIALKMSCNNVIVPHWNVKNAESMTDKEKGGKHKLWITAV